MSELEKRESGIAVSPAQAKLDRLIAKRTQAQRIVLVLDCSGSMSSEADSPGERRIDALRGVVNSLRLKGMTFRQLIFNSSHMWSDVIPEPAGGTDMAGAFEFCAKINPEHVIVVSDGQPDNPQAALLAAKQLRCKVDVFYVGPSNDTHCKDFLQSLATSTGGSSQAVSFAELEAKVAGMLGTGSDDAPQASKPIAL